MVDRDIAHALPARELRAEPTPRPPMQEKVRKTAAKALDVKLPVKPHEKMRIAGKLVDAEERVEVCNPYTGRVVATVPAASPRQVADAFKAANAYRSRLSRYDRQKILLRTAELLASRRDEIAALITAESGLCWKDSTYEVGRAYDVYSLAGQLAIRDDGEVYSCDVTPQGKPRKIFTTRTPLLGVLSAITPFNHPLNMISHKLAPAIATNNRIVAKPTELTPLTALLLADILYEAGLPPEMLSVVTGNPRTMGDAMITDPHADVVTFTGSVKVGKYIAEKAGYKRLVLELGGNDPLIVCDDLADADLDRAAELAVQGATRNSGQRCTAVKRILCMEAVADAFVAKVLAKAKKVKSGDPMDPTVDIGTVIHEGAARLFEARVNDAVKQGAELLVGNNRKGALYPATVVDRVPATAELVHEETFGPVIPVIRVPNDIEQVIRLSNSTAFGLSSGVCTNRLDTATRFINGLHVGTVNIWEVPGYRIEMSPFGGIKDSGLGYKEGVWEAMKSYTNVKTYSLPWPQG
jgi:putative phosphonoacetaldehyde dehydrogenase